MVIALYVVSVTRRSSGSGVARGVVAGLYVRARVRACAGARQIFTYTCIHTISRSFSSKYFMVECRVPPPPYHRASSAEPCAP